MNIPAHRTIFTEEEILRAQLAIRDIMSTGQMILGKYTELFEESYANLHNRKYGVAVASDTAGIEILLRTYGIGEGDKVLFPTNGFYGIILPILRCKAEPVFFDIDEGTNLYAHASSLEEYMKKDPAIKAVILMHTAGLVASTSREVSNLCKERGILCIEDAAHAPGAKMNGEYAGSFGDASVFSLYATKPINAGEGGMILTDDANTASMARVYRNYGRESSFGSGVHTVEGYSWRLPEIQAAIGLNQVKRQDEIRAERENIACNYFSFLYSLEAIGVKQFTMEVGSAPNWYRYLLLLPKHWTLADKQAMKERVKEGWHVNLPGDVYEMLAHKQSLWKGKYDHLDFPVANDWVNRHFSLPIYNTLTLQEQKYIIKAVREGCEWVESRR